MPFVAGLAAALVRRRAPVEFSTGSIASFERDGDAFRLAACWSPRS
jgi:phosphohistidine phosphatase SixA